MWTDADNECRQHQDHASNQVGRLRKHACNCKKKDSLIWKLDFLWFIGYFINKRILRELDDF
jgi:hypothetical protein